MTEQVLKITKDTKDLTNIINHLNLTNIFSGAHAAFTPYIPCDNTWFCVHEV